VIANFEAGFDAYFLGDDTMKVYGEMAVLPWWLNGWDLAVELDAWMKEEMA